MNQAKSLTMLLRKPVATSLAMLTAAALTASGLPAVAQEHGGGPPIIRDAEIEQLLREYSQPILKAAGLAQQNIRVVIINDPSFNAFVADGHRIFINSGALMQAKTPNEVIGVLAHESGHIAGGHIARMHEELAKASTESAVAMLLGIGAMVAGARSGGQGADAGMAALTMPQGVIQNTMLAYIRTQEEQADRAGVKFLTATGQSPKGMYDTFKRLGDEMLYQAQHIDPYLQTHPMPAERVAALEELVKNSPYWDKKDPPELQFRHDMMRAKLYGYMDREGISLNRYPPSDQSLPARYARAIAASRFSDTRTAVAQIDALIASNPQYPYFYELKGQTLLEAGKPAEAIAPLRRAAQLSPNPALIQVMLGQALVESNDPSHLNEAVTVLESSLAREPESPAGYNQLAMAYGRKGDYAHADLASAQAALARGDMKAARMLASRAKDRFPLGSPGWVRADDISNKNPEGTAHSTVVVHPKDPPQ
ncbi:MAG TPA: M48 family metalloprotease [Xanthobacteraceae bacterium]|nr:M48 family metalloprotease [Xanthobacteraceae bacterium]